MSKSSELLVCTSCGRPQSQAGHLCEHCGAPLTPFAHSDPVLGIQARGFAAYKATHEPRKLIVVVGMWIWLLPMLCMGLILGFQGGLAMKELFDGEHSDWVPALLLFAIGAGFTMLAAWILFRTTYSYICQPLPELSSRVGAAEADGSDDDEELDMCLACGEELLSETKQCPACGWTYSLGE